MLRKILFVDDDRILRAAFEQILAGYRDHFTAVMANDGFEAVQLLKKLPFSLVILDLVMPRMDGISLLKHIRDNYPDIPVAIISGMPLEKMHQLATTGGIVAYISKPFQADDLISVIMTTLRKEAEGGTMHDVSPAVFLQFMEMDAKTCTIRVLDKVSQQGGVLFFIDGQLVDARIGEMTGMDAALEVFTWDAVTLFLRNACAPRTDIINSGLQPIIMKAAGMKDESGGDDMEPGDSQESLPAPAAIATKAPVAMASDLDDLVLPEDFPTPQTFADLEAVELRLDEDEEDAGPNRELIDLLGKGAGIRCSPTDIDNEPALNMALLQLSALGAGSQFGEFRVGYITTGGKTDRVLLPRQPATIVNVQPNSPKDKIIDLLRTGAGTTPVLK
ncbi:MAG: response regulator [Desulforhopalus sp.]|nr:response regulator [Desulforhopalus sp.]